MAMKDWKKILKNKNKLVYQSKISGERLILDKQDKKSIYSTKSTPLWVVYNSSVTTNKGFNTKSQAIKFAKSYMKKN